MSCSTPIRSRPKGSRSSSPIASRCGRRRDGPAAARDVRRRPDHRRQRRRHRPRRPDRLARGTVLGVPDYTLDRVASSNQATTLTLHGRYIPGQGHLQRRLHRPRRPTDYAVTLPTSVNDNTVRPAGSTSRSRRDNTGSVSPTGARSSCSRRSTTCSTTISPAMPSGNLSAPTGVLFDPIGRAFKVGVRASPWAG